ncbi:MAG: hypothetical protein DDT35_00089 [Firmicutes bacterium]|nr:hypothetical protein [Bacillota bacterium]
MLVLLFFSVHHALAAECILKERQIKYELMPTPRAITAHCGLSICMASEDYNRVQALLAESGVDITATYERLQERDSYRLLIIKE